MVAFDGSGLAQQPVKHGRPSQPFRCYRRPFHANQGRRSEQHRRPCSMLPLATAVHANQGRHSE